MIPCYQVSSLLDFMETSSNNYKSAKVVLINEAQFFPDLYESVLKMLSSNKKVYIVGLDGDFEKNKFGEILDLIPHCDKVQKLNSLWFCKTGEPGFSQKIDF